VSPFFLGGLLTESCRSKPLVRRTALSAIEGWRLSKASAGGWAAPVKLISDLRSDTDSAIITDLASNVSFPGEESDNGQADNTSDIGALDTFVRR
jgi:hypothetical protein